MTSSSATMRRRERSPVPDRPRRRMGSADGSNRRMAGFSASRGSVTRSSFSRASSAARSMFVFHANSSVTWDRPERERLVRRWTPEMIPTDSSIGRVTRLSTSAGAAPAYFVSMVSVGYEISGRRLTGSRVNDTAPKMTVATTSMPMATGRRTEQRDEAHGGPRTEQRRLLRNRTMPGGVAGRTGRSTTRPFGCRPGRRP